MENEPRSSVEIEQFEKWRDDFKSEGVHPETFCECICHERPSLKAYQALCACSVQ